MPPRSAPWLAYRHEIAAGAADSFLLESVEGGAHLARYSFLGRDPFLVVRSQGGNTILDAGGDVTVSERPFVETLRELMAAYHSPAVPGLPRFTGGAVGYLGYDVAAWF